MNKVFKSVWSEALGAWVAASELCRGRGKGGKAARSMLATALILAAGNAMANTAAGSGATTNGPNDTAVGDNAVASGSLGADSTAVGHNVKTNAANATAIGSTIANNAASSIVMGNGGTNAVTMDAGSTNTVFFAPNGGAVTNSANSFAFNPYGTAGTVNSIDSVNISGTVTSAANAVALGSKSVVSAANSVALGAGSVADQANTVSVGSTTSQRKITNVKAGDVNASSTDAVNGSQLAATNATVADAVKYDSTTHDSVTLGNTGAPVKVTNVKAGDVNASSTDAVNGSQLAATNATVASIRGAVAVGGNASSTGDMSMAFGMASQSTGVRAAALGTSATASGSYSVALGASSQSPDDYTVSVGSSTLKRQIVNVAAGDVSATSTDALNGSQLYANAASNVAALGGNSSVNADGTVSAPTYSVGGTNATSVGAALTNIDGRVTANSGDISTLNSQMANTVNYDSDTGHASMTLSGTAGTVIKNVAAGQMTADSTEAVNGAQLFSVQQSIGEQSAMIADSVHYDSASHDKITFGDLGAGPVAITNVKAGDVSEASTDAVNGSQLFTVTKNVAQNTADIASLNSSISDLSNGASGLVHQDAVTQAISVGENANGSSVSFAGLQGARVLTGVANGAVGSASLDAINGSQLFNTSRSVAAALGGGAGVDGNGGVTAPMYFVGGKQVGDVGSAVTNLDSRVTQNAADIASLKGGTGDGSNAPANAVAYDSADHSKVTLGGTGASTAVQFTNVAAGDLSETSTDAVNGSQLGATNARVSATESAIANFQALGVSGWAGTGDESAAIGANSEASGVNSTATGANSTASASDSTAAGANATASGDSSTATGAHSMASGSSSTAAGANSMASGDTSAAFGGNAAASGSNAVAIGGNSQASGNGSLALGGNSSSTADNSVALGANSVADEANTVSVGSAGNERRVANVAPGVNGTDATNVNQLNALRNDVGASMRSLQRSAFAGVAAAMAMPNLMPSAPGKVVMAAGVGNFKGYGAFGAGATYRSGDGKWLVNGAVSVTGSGDAGARAQVGYEF